MLSKNLFLGLAILLAAVVLILACSNTASIPIAFLSWHWNAPLYLLIAKCFVLGALSSFCIWGRKRTEVKIEQKKLEWKTEDAKLQTEIQSDKVHQLELQVKTLESALDKALKRGKQ